MLRLQIIICTASIMVVLSVFELIRRGKLKEEYSLLWLLSGGVLLIFGLFPNLLNVIADAIGIYYLTALFIISFLFLLVIVLHFSTVISQLSEKNKTLAQDISILDLKFREMEQKITNNSDSGSDLASK